MPMNIDNLEIVKTLISPPKKENERVEFKETTGQLERGMETLCAFLNGEGGIVLFGVNDKGKIIGQEVGDWTKRDIAEAIHRFEPFARVEVAYIDIPDSGKKVIAVMAEDQKNMRPFTYKGRPYQRIESTTVVMPQEVYNYLLMQRGGKYIWDSIINPALKISDLDEEAIMGVVRGGIRSGRLPENTIREQIPAILEKFSVYKDGQLNNAAAVLFGRNLYDYPQCLLRLARFKGTTKDEFVDNQRATGNIYQLLDAAMAFFFKHLSLSAKIEGLYREEELSIPYKALRECCINAFCHRVYHRTGSSVGIAIYDDRVEIENSGTFPPDIPLDKLLSGHNSSPQNSIIANVLYKSNVLENRGRGIRLMEEECRRVGIPDPEFHTDGGAVWVVFHYKRYESGPDRPSTDQVRDLIKVLGDRELSVTELMDLMGLSHRPTFRTNYLHPALNEGYIVPRYPVQPNHPKEKYRLTNKGKI